MERSTREEVGSLAATPGSSTWGVPPGKFAAHLVETREMQIVFPAKQHQSSFTLLIKGLRLDFDENLVLCLVWNWFWAEFGGEEHQKVDWPFFLFFFQYHKLQQGVAIGPRDKVWVGSLWRKCWQLLERNKHETTFHSQNLTNVIRNTSHILHDKDIVFCFEHISIAINDSQINGGWFCLGI